MAIALIICPIYRVACCSPCGISNPDQWSEATVDLPVNVVFAQAANGFLVSRLIAPGTASHTFIDGSPQESGAKFMVQIQSEGRTYKYDVILEQAVPNTKLLYTVSLVGGIPRRFRHLGDRSRSFKHTMKIELSFRADGEASTIVTVTQLQHTEDIPSGCWLCQSQHRHQVTETFKQMVPQVFVSFRTEISSQPVPAQSVVL